MRLTLRFSAATVKGLEDRLRVARQGDDPWLVRRITALLGLGAGHAPSAVAALLRVSESSVYSWLKHFLVEGMNSLVRRRSSGRPPRLTRSQKQQLCEWIRSGPEAAGYPTGCWNALLVQDLILSRFQVAYNRFYVCQLLRNLGFTYQKARFVSDHLDEEARRHWLEHTWPEIERQAEREEALIVFVDEAGFPQWGSLGYTWSPRGQQPTVRTTGKRKGYKVFGAVDFVSGRFFYQASEDRFTSETYQAFVADILQKTEDPIYLIQDGARYHTSASTRAFFTRHAERLRVIQLPSYSPDYNPTEYVWRKVKRQATHNRYFPEFDALTGSVGEALDYLAAHPAEILQVMGCYIDEPVAGPMAA